MLPVYPFDPERVIGTISEVGPATAAANLPRATTAEGQWHHGNRLGSGEVGEFVVIECGDLAIFGRIISVKLPERERLAVEPGIGKGQSAHPVGSIQLLTTISLRDGLVTGGISRFPRLGARVYAAHPLLVKWLAESVQRTPESKDPLALRLAHLPGTSDTEVNITPERLFGRHCAVLGATGGGKSWTVARLIEQAAQHKSKLLLLDATGEFHTLTSMHVRHLHIGTAESSLPSTEVVFPYFELTESDLFALFKPSGQIQAPKLRLAMKSLKLAKLSAGTTLVHKDGHIVKADKPKAPFVTAYKKHATIVEGPTANFDVACLIQQINQECVWISKKDDHATWGGFNEQERAYCVSLITRIEDILHSYELACVFQPGTTQTISTALDEFLQDDGPRVLRLSLKHLSFSHNAREIIANAIGRHVLSLARAGTFKERPLVVFLDEAHQFLSKALGDETTKYPLDSFDLIAKEGRKFGLNICLATQRPRDIPEDVLSQMGTLIVHRLINDRDREVVERASGDIDRSAAAFLPSLAPGQAVIVGVDFPIPLTIQVWEPSHKPDSRGPDYQKHWA